jgi:hypothetical protein
MPRWARNQNRQNDQPPSSAPHFNPFSLPFKGRYLERAKGGTPANRREAEDYDAVRQYEKRRQEGWEPGKKSASA